MTIEHQRDIVENELRCTELVAPRNASTFMKYVDQSDQAPLFSLQVFQLSSRSLGACYVFSGMNTFCIPSETSVPKARQECL